MAYKPTVQCVLYNAVGFSAITDTYEVDGVSHDACVALYSSEGTLLSMDTSNTCQFTQLTQDTDYVLKAVYLTSREFGGVIPNTTVNFHTKLSSYYKPVVDYDREEGSMEIEAMSDSKWFPSNTSFNGFGIGVEVVNASGTVVKSSTETPASFDGLTAGAEYTVRAFRWHGKEDVATRVRYGAVPDTSAVYDPDRLDVFAFPEYDNAELHVRLQRYESPTLFELYMDGVKKYEKTTNIENKVYVVQLNDLDQGESYTIDAHVVEDGIDNYRSISFTTNERQTSAGRAKPTRFKDFFIAVGQPGAYSNNMVYTEVFGLNERFGIKIKHAPYSPMAKVKNMVVQSWKDEDGDDVWLPRTTALAPGEYDPAITHEAVEYNPTFVIYGDADRMNSNEVIRQLVQSIEGRWLKIWDEYTKMGFEGVYLMDVDDDPKFKRRDYDYVQFQLKFKINGTNIDAPFDGVE